ncbi:hypothetical protein GA0061093_11722 [Rhodococcus qingshengii]|nr:hypothetical protein GA0061093_11722 [Rhodococcus qingshengii]
MRPSRPLTTGPHRGTDRRRNRPDRHRATRQVRRWVRHPAGPRMSPAATDGDMRLRVPTRRAVGDAGWAGVRRSPGRRTRSSDGPPAPTGDETPTDRYTPELNRHRACNPGGPLQARNCRGVLTADRGQPNPPTPPGKGNQKARRLRSVGLTFIVPGQALSVFSELFRALAARRKDASTSQSRR